MGEHQLTIRAGGVSLDAGRAFASVDNFGVSEDGARRAASPTSGHVARWRRLEAESRFEIGAERGAISLGVLCGPNCCRDENRREHMAEI